MQRWIYRLPEPVEPLSPAVTTRILMEKLGPTYVKLGQIVSSQANVLPDEWRTELDKLQNEVPPFPYEQVREVIIAELGAPPEELYAEFDPKPLAAASLGQVHRAVLHDGTKVAVKVQRPNLDKQVRADLGIIRLFGGYAERRSTWAREVGIRSMLDEFGSTLQEELDYYAEAYNMDRLTTNLEPIEGVHIATLYRDLSTKRVLTQEFVTGVKISDVEAMTAAGLDLPAIGDAALRAAMKMLLIDGVFHADPHPGNLIVNLDTGVVTFLDCGMVGELSIAQRAHLVMFLWTFVKGDVAAMGQQLRSLSVPFRPIDENRFLKDFERRMSRYQQGSKPDVKLVMSEATGILRDNGLRLDPQLTLALKAMVQASAFFTRLAPPDRTFTDVGAGGRTRPGRRHVHRGRPDRRRQEGGHQDRRPRAAGGPGVPQGPGVVARPGQEGQVHPLPRHHLAQPAGRHAALDRRDARRRAAGGRRHDRRRDRVQRVQQPGLRAGRDVRGVGVLRLGRRQRRARARLLGPDGPRPARPSARVARGRPTCDADHDPACDPPASGAPAQWRDGHKRWRIRGLRVFSSAADAPRVRRPTDVLLAGLMLLALLALSLAAPGPTDLGAATTQALADLTGVWEDVWAAGYALLALWPLTVALLALARRGRRRLLVDLVAAVAAALGIALLIGKLEGTDWADSLAAVTSTGPPQVYVGVRLALATALVVAASPHLSRPLRLIGRVVLLLGAVSTAALGVAYPIGIAAGLAVGLLAAAATHLLLGSPGGQLTAQQVAEALADLGLDATAVRPSPVQAPGASIFQAEDADAGALLVKVYGRDAWDSQFLASLWTALVKRGERPRLGRTRTGQLEHEAVATLIAERAGVPVLPVVTVGQTSDNDALLATRLAGRRLAAVPAEEVTDGQLAARSGARWPACTAPGSRTAGSTPQRIFLLDDGGVALADLGESELAADDDAIALDQARLLVATAAIVGHPRAVAVALAEVGAEGIADVLPYLQPAALDAATRKAVRGGEWDLDELRAAAAEAAGGRAAAARAVAPRHAQGRRAHRGRHAAGVLRHHHAGGRRLPGDRQRALRGQLVAARAGPAAVAVRAGRLLLRHPRRVDQAAALPAGAHAAVRHPVHRGRGPGDGRAAGPGDPLLPAVRAWPPPRRCRSAWSTA